MIAQTWYSCEVGDPELREMNPTKNHEQLNFNLDGTVKFIVLHKVMGKMEYAASWEYNDVNNTIDLEIDFDGQKERQSVTIEKIDENNMILISPQKITSYTTTISDAFKESGETASSSTEILGVDLDAWTGTAEFNEAAIVVDDKRTETSQAKDRLN